MLGLMHPSRLDTARPQNTLSDAGCIGFSVTVNVSCHVAVHVSHPPFSSGIGTGIGGIDLFLLQVL